MRVCLQVREFKEAFGFFNAQNPRANELSAHEIFDVMTRFEPHKDLDIKEIEALIREVDTDDTGTIDFPKFLKIMGRTSAATESLTDQEDVMFAAFQFFCDIGHGEVGNPTFTEHELAQIMDLMGEQMSGEEMHEMLQFLDPDNKGEVTFDDFMDVMKKI